MSKIRIYELAKKVGVGNKDVISELSKLGIEGKTHASAIDDDIAEKIETAIKGKNKAGAKPKITATPPATAAKPVETPAETLVESTLPQTPKPKIEAPRPKPKITEAAAVQPLAAAAEKKAPASITKTELPVETQRLAEEPAAVVTDEPDLAVPDRFKKDLEAENVEKFKAKPAMQRAFQTVRKIEPKKWQDSKSFRRGGKDKGGQKTAEQGQAPITAPRKKFLKIHEGITVKEFAEVISVKHSDVIKKFMEMGYMPTINQPVEDRKSVV